MPFAAPLLQRPTLVSQNRASYYSAFSHITQIRRNTIELYISICLVEGADGVTVQNNLSNIAYLILTSTSLISERANKLTIHSTSVHRPAQ